MRRSGRSILLAAAGAIAVLASAPAIAEDAFAVQRARMIGVIERHARTAHAALGRKHIDKRILEVMDAVPRHLFVSERQYGQAYDDRPLPIGYGQTISQPFIVALMTDLLQVDDGHAVLEIGTGSGYQAAVLARLAARVCTVEIIPQLARVADERLGRLDYDNVQTRTGDGYYGWPECGPFDGIVVTAAAGQIPPPLIEQLKPGGRMVIPVGTPFVVQHLMIVTKLPDGGVKTRQTLPVRFVPLTRR